MNEKKTLSLPSRSLLFNVVLNNSDTTQQNEDKITVGAKQRL
jgi:hypothetical protein